LNNYTILAPAFYNSWNKVKYLKQSADRWGVPITFYGFGEPYRGWHDVQIDRLITEVEKIETKWVIYTDASDTIINGAYPLDSTITALVDPPEPWATLIFSVESPGHLCAGGLICNTGTLLPILKQLKEFRPCNFCDSETSNPQIKWQCYMGHWREEYKDYGREIFQVADEPLEIRNGRVYNPRTQTFPFIVHWAGGYTDPEVGKEALMGDVCRQLGYE